MKHLTQQIIDQIIKNECLINDYPKSGVIFLTLDALFNDAVSRKIVADAVIAAVNKQSFDSVASIASRGYIFSGIIANQFTDKGEHFIQKVKSKGDTHYVQIDTQTEYSTDALQVLKNTIQKGKKYLLTDDLIATGGSIMTALQLIRECGGEVDTAFVMTELLDFGAREQLKKAGVELISLLAFTNQDLQKLLDMQHCYHENPGTPITYQLTHHTKLKDEMMAKNRMEIEDQHFNIRRLVNINHNKSKNKLAKKGVLFAASTKPCSGKSIDLYNHGCPVNTWKIPTETVKRNDFKVFATGDAFTILSPDLDINAADINIHVGINHTSYSPLVLLQEALQLCRLVYEHGAGEVTVALPEQYHPVLYHNDFNLLLMKLFKASGANKIYFYDKNYKGTLDETNSKAIIPLTLSQQADIENYQLSRSELLDYLHSSTDAQTLDKQVMYFMRKSYLNQAWAKCDIQPTNIIENLCGSSLQMTIPEIQNRPHVLLCCSANKPIAEKIAENLRQRGEIVKLFHIEGKGEHTVIPSDAEICGATVTIVQSTRPNPDDIKESREYQINGASSYFFEAAMIARQAHLRGADKINLINPYQFSARSDKAEDTPQGKTGAYVQQNGLLFKAAGVNQVISAECHDAHTMCGSFTGQNIKGSAVSALSIMSTKIANDWIDDPVHPMQGQLRLVTPDAGATKRTNQLTQQLQAILGKKLCESRVLGEKHRDSHQDDSALINSLHSGAIGINANDKYLITDDETATGTTLCQAITNLKKNGAHDIAVIVVHNNMPLDWLLRQLCLTRFLYLGVNELHFSDTQEMGTLANSYDDLILTYSHQLALPREEVEKQVYAWFKKNISDDFTDKTSAHLTYEFDQFKLMFNELQTRIKVHSLANEFAQQVLTRLDMQKMLPAVTQGFYSADNGSLSLFPSKSTKLQVNDVSPESVVHESRCGS